MHGSLSSSQKQELTRLLEEQARRRDRNRLAAYRPYGKQAEFHAAGKDHRERLFMAGNQLGKGETDLSVQGIELSAQGNITATKGIGGQWPSMTSFQANAGSAGQVVWAQLMGGKDSGNNVTVFGSHVVKQSDHTDGSEDGEQYFEVPIAGTLTRQLGVKNGVAIGTEAGAPYQGAGTLNVQTGLYVGGTILPHAVLQATTASFLTAHATKLGHIAVTQAVDLDAIETRVNGLDAAVVLKGTWDASAGTFPGGGTAQAGDSWIVSVGGTVNSVTFNAGDRIIAIADNASTATFASNWFKADYTDQVLTVAGKTGTVTLQVADITDMSANGRSLVSAADYAAMRGLLGVAAGDSPQFTAINLGHASDTTLTRTGAGDIAIEGNAVYRAGGADVPLADGGTGASLADPNADRIMFWDDSAGGVTWLAPNTGLAISGTSLNVAVADSNTQGIVELATNAEVQARADTTRAVTPAGLAAATRELLTANRTYYVRSDGSDSNTGLVNSAGGAFLTRQKAADIVLGLDLNGFDVTVQIVDGSYSGTCSMTAPLVGKGTLTFLGNTGTPANVAITSAATNCWAASGGAKYTISGMRLSNSTSSHCVTVSGSGSLVTIGAGVEFSTSANAHMNADTHGRVDVSANYAVVGGAVNHWSSSLGGFIVCFGRTVTITGTPAFSGQWSQNDGLGLQVLLGNTYSGSATGKRHNVTNNSVTQTSGGTLPGNVAGTTGTGGQYS